MKIEEMIEVAPGVRASISDTAVMLYFLMIWVVTLLIL